MKKRTLIFVLVGMLTFSTSIAYATGTNLQAIVSDLKLYLNNEELDQDVVTINGMPYVSLIDISESLNVETKSNLKKQAIYITSEKMNNTDISSVVKENTSLQKENLEQKNEIKALKEELALYKGEVPDDAEYKALTNFIVDENDSKVYRGNWNSATPFKSNGKIYNKNVWGFRFNYEKRVDKYKYPTYIFQNKDLKLKKFKFTCVRDDLTNDKNYDVNSKVEVVGISDELGIKSLFIEEIKNNSDIKTHEVDITGFKEFRLCILPPRDSTCDSYYKNSMLKDSFGIRVYDDYVLIMNPEVK